MPGERGVRGACWELRSSAGIAGHAGNVVCCSCWDCRVVVKRWLRSENQRATVPQRSGGPGVMGLREPGKERGGPLQALPPVPHPPPHEGENPRFRLRSDSSEGFGVLQNILRVLSPPLGGGLCREGGSRPPCPHADSSGLCL